MLDRLLHAAFGFLSLEPREPELRLLHRWLDSWTGVGLLAAGLYRKGWDLQLTAYGDSLELFGGQRVRVDARLHVPTGYRNPGGFDYVAKLARDGIHVTGSARTF